MLGARCRQWSAGLSTLTVGQLLILIAVALLPQMQRTPLYMPHAPLTLWPPLTHAPHAPHALYAPHAPHAPYAPPPQMHAPGPPWPPYAPQVQPVRWAPQPSGAQPAWGDWTAR